jgi:anti-sigma B factor antagonist
MWNQPQSITVTEFSEPFDVQSCSRTRSTFRDHVRDGKYVHIVDLRQLETTDALVLKAIIIALRIVREAGGQLCVVVDNPNIRRALSLTALDRVFPVHANLDEAYSALDYTLCFAKRA